MNEKAFFYLSDRMPWPKLSLSAPHPIKICGCMSVVWSINVLQHGHCQVLLSHSPSISQLTIIASISPLFAQTHKNGAWSHIRPFRCCCCSNRIQNRYLLKIAHHWRGTWPITFLKVCYLLPQLNWRSIGSPSASSLCSIVAAISALKCYSISKEISRNDPQFAKFLPVPLVIAEPAHSRATGSQVPQRMFCHIFINCVCRYAP